MEDIVRDIEVFRKQPVLRFHPDEIKGRPCFPIHGPPEQDRIPAHCTEYAGQLAVLKDFKYMFTAASWLKIRKKSHQLDHANVQRFIGIGITGSIVEPVTTCYVMTPWMKHGNILQYLESYPNTSHRKMIEGIASGITFI